MIILDRDLICFKVWYDLTWLNITENTADFSVRERLKWDPDAVDALDAVWMP